jgi:flagellar biosynthesis/type III secretory pathway chaperone
LNDLLRAEYDCAGRLGTLLGIEAAALQGRDIDAIEALVDRKQALIQEFESLEARRQSLLKRTGFGGAQPDVEGCIAWCDGSGKLARGWRLLLERIRGCQHQNRCNGAILESSRRHAQQALALLRGQSPHTGLYNPNGASASTDILGRSLAKA